ncbi:MAG: organoarsenical effux MFS transporter ArsJ [Solirubrobacterales bacterium]|nr:organoarsenical effux MFS transporter ArsJ [Solirubrobacterales bacterium]
MSGTGVSGDLRNYILVTAAYWSNTLADGAARILVLFYFFDQGYSPFEVATLFVLYEFFGIVTNLVGGWIASRLGLKSTLFSGLLVQLVALGMLGLVPSAWLVVPWVMASQALSGIAKDLTKMSSKSAVKLVAPEDSESSLFRWVAVLTGSKNALKGVGFFLGGVLLTLVGFQTAMVILMALVASGLVLAATMMHGDLGRADVGARFRHMFSHERAINMLAAARLFLFASRDVWFVVGLPVYLESVLGWSFWEVGGFLAIWVIGYGIVQASAPSVIGRRGRETGRTPDGRTATRLALVLALLPALIAIAVSSDLDPTLAIVVGLIIFGVVFAMNSSVHSYLILSYATSEKIAKSVGFYYMANAGGRLLGTALSGLLYQWQGLSACLWVSCGFVLASAALSTFLPAASRRSHRRLRDAV